MKSILMTLTAASVLVLAGNAYASEELAKTAGCTAKCHALDTKKKGPSFKTSAAKYKGKGEAAILAGFKKEHDDVKASDEEVKTLLKWILTL